jgi:hypothetical protein
MDERHRADDSALAAATRHPAFRTVEWLLRWRYVLITIVAYLFCVVNLHSRGDWEFFVRGSQLLFGEHHVHSLLPGGFRLYANYPETQIGPLSLLVATPFRIFGDNSRGAAAVALTAAAPTLIYAMERLARRMHPSGGDLEEMARRICVLVGGLLLAPAWSLVATSFTHLDDVLVLGCACAAMWYVACGRPALLGTAIGLAIAAKPWGVILLPLVLVHRGPRLVRSIVAAATVAALAWMPFVLADRHTLSAIRPNTDVSPASVIHLLGTSLDATPSWVRPTQLVAGMIVGVIAIARGRWPAVLVAGIVTRLLLDPGTWGYYSSGAVFAALAWDLLRRRRPRPAWTVVTFAALVLTTNLPSSLQAALRLLACVAIAATVVAPRTSHPSSPDSSDVRLDV